MRPRTGDVDDRAGEGGVSRIQTAALLAFPEPRRIAGRPVDWMADIIAEGGVVPVVVRREVGREKKVDWMPV